VGEGDRDALISDPPPLHQLAGVLVTGVDLDPEATRQPNPARPADWGRAGRGAAKASGVRIGQDPPAMAADSEKG
jgi:hypothetical protein